MVQPAARREGFSAIPNVKWVDVGGLDYLREEFERYIVRRIKFPEEYEVIINDHTIFFLSHKYQHCYKLTLTFSHYIENVFICLHAMSTSYKF